MKKSYLVLAIVLGMVMYIAMSESALEAEQQQAQQMEREASLKKARARDSEIEAFVYKAALLTAKTEFDVRQPNAPKKASFVNRKATCDDVAKGLGAPDESDDYENRNHVLIRRLSYKVEVEKMGRKEWLFRCVLPDGSLFQVFEVDPQGMVGRYWNESDSGDCHHTKCDYVFNLVN